MINALLEIIGDNVRSFKVTLLLSRVMLKKRHKISDLGWFWAIVKPLMYIAMFYVAISTGFRKATDIPGIVTPYIIWIASGLTAWFFMQDLINGGSACLRANKKLIVNTKVPSTTIPMALVISFLYIHFIIIGIVIVLALLLGVRPDPCWLQLPIYILLSVIFTYTWALLTGMLSLLSNDISEFIKTIRPAFFWLSGILFNSRTHPRLFFRYNPITYIVEGYRNSLCYNMWIWEDTKSLAAFLEVLAVLIIITILIYKKLKDRIVEYV